MSSALTLAACGLDESGTQADASQLDATTDVVADTVVKDSPPADTYVPPTCATIDAACLGADVPDGWSLIGVSEDAGSACPGDDENFDPHSFVANPRVRSDSCTCAPCTTTGAWDCNGNVSITGGVSGACNDQDATFANAARCVPLSESSGVTCLLAQSATVNVIEPTPTGSPTCDASFTGNQLADTDTALGCRPVQCTTDYCGMRAHGFQTCIVHNSDPSGACPSGFHPAFGTSALASAPGNVIVSCAGCACQVSAPPSSCTGTVRVFNATNTGAACDGDGGTNGLDYVETLDATACQSTGTCAYTSLYYVPNAVSPTSCTPSTTTLTAGDASLTNAVTICCAP